MAQRILSCEAGKAQEKGDPSQARSSPSSNSPSSRHPNTSSPFYFNF